MSFLTRFLALLILFSFSASAGLAEDGAFKADVVEGHGTQRILVLKGPDGAPVEQKDLKVTHEAKVHLFIIDDTLTDYQHIHPRSSQRPGEYTFTFSPATPHDYAVWAEFTTFAAGPQRVQSVMRGAAPCRGAGCVEMTEAGSLEGISPDGATKAALSFNGAALVAGKSAAVKIRITDDKGMPVKDLEPVMGAFSHLAGFYVGRSEMLHAHPTGPAPRSAKSRGGPELRFHLTPEYAGMIKLFVQIRRGGKDVFIPISLNIDKE